ncbi:hypothetical protein HTV80_02760 [Streptomyces sp. Vc74B-19]|uniref:hypothetical protein n=1 Tax=unclassified Streptomyces TaxID=2593676 RepID=UPI001BFC4FEC|nr:MULTISPECIES: hypothetical protein [unclassified Streptomyces]MBT3162033.1 hypothetical protein [Streptomyces sp. Vc74B-19]MCO4697675.1 hypothetical protein [Streptomyces sp. RO-S4]MDU0299747.1 hypothetical protein [Streptomyces sp. PAL114]
MTHARSACVLILLAAVGCTSTNGTDEKPEPPKPAAAVSPAARQPAPVTPPPLDAGSGESTAGQHGPARGNAVFPYTAGTRGKALTVAVSCRGRGGVEVRLPVPHADFRLACGSGDSAVTYHQLALPAAHRAGSVRVTAPSGITWAVTVGRSDPAAEDRATATG